MQRRATAIYATFFFVIAIGSYAGLGLIAQPALSMDNPEQTLSVNDTFSVGDRSYTVTAIDGGADSDGNLQRSGTVEWVNETGTHISEWANNSTFEHQNETYFLLTNTSGEQPTATLTQPVNRTAILVNDSAARNELVTSNGTDYVVIGSNDNQEMVRADEYFPTPPTQTLEANETFDFYGNETTVTEITNDSVTVQWQAPKTNTIDLGATTTHTTTLVRGGLPADKTIAAGANVTLNGEQFAVHYPDNTTATLSSDPATYHNSLAEITDWFDRIRGLWAVTVMSALAGLLLIALAALPRRG
ncbi:hypothetical protein [Halocatena halophila]|uniref:hypothetical protein n=1 Tax=Halocatena halophila TaxID=2814576 RepID=UPI002ED04C7D